MAKSDVMNLDQVLLFLQGNFDTADVQRLYCSRLIIPVNDTGTRRQWVR